MAAKGCCRGARPRARFWSSRRDPPRRRTRDCLALWHIPGRRRAYLLRYYASGLCLATVHVSSVKPLLRCPRRPGIVAGVHLRPLPPSCEGGKWGAAARRDGGDKPGLTPENGLTWSECLKEKLVGTMGETFAFPAFSPDAAVPSVYNFADDILRRNVNAGSRRPAPARSVPLPVRLPVASSVVSMPGVQEAHRRSWFS
jgi:hypothetical protein